MPMPRGALSIFIKIEPAHAPGPRLFAQMEPERLAGFAGVAGPEAVFNNTFDSRLRHAHDFLRARKPARVSSHVGGAP